MSDDPQPQGLTVLGRCGLREAWLRLVSDQAKPGIGRAAAKGAAQGEGIASEG